MSIVVITTRHVKGHTDYCVPERHDQPHKQPLSSERYALPFMAPEYHCLARCKSQLNYILSQLNPVHILPLYFLKPIYCVVVCDAVHFVKYLALPIFGEETAAFVNC